MAGLAALCTGTLFGATSIVLPGNPLWGSENSGGGSSVITSAAPRSGSGSLEMYGDRTRFFGLGNPYSQASNLGPLSALTDFRFDWMVAIGSSQGTTPNYSPALRIHVWDNGVRSELIWENAYNGPTPVTQGVWYSSLNGDNFYRFTSGQGVTLSGPPSNALVTIPLSSWINPANGWYSANAYISAISIGVGSSAGATYHAFADNVVLGLGATSTTYNFETAAPDTACPIISNIQLPAVVAISTGVYLTANIDDTATGGSSIASASYSVNGGPPVAMVASDGAFDESSEDVTAFLSFSSAGIYTIALSGTDAAGNTCTEQIMIVAYDPSAGFVTGGGWINSPAGAFVGPSAWQALWNQDFSTGTTGWLDANSSGYGLITALPDGTARVEGDANSGPFSRFDGYHSTWPGTWIAEIDVYLDPAAWAAGYGFDYSVAANNAAGAHRRDFIFHVTKDTSTGKLLIGGSNNSSFLPREDLESLANHYEVTAAGWYTLQHRFYDTGGVLAVDLNVVNASGQIVFTETRSDPTDLIPSVVGGNRYAWFTHVTVPGGIVVDNHQRFEFRPTYPAGRANFGFVSKYKKGATVPEGSTEFVFQAGGLNFHSSAYEWLVVNQGGTNAQFKGTGRINGAGNYGFMIWASDNGNGGSADTFRIQIVDKDNADAVVYDNGSNQLLGGGNILIQTKK